MVFAPFHLRRPCRRVRENLTKAEKDVVENSKSAPCFKGHMVLLLLNMSISYHTSFEDGSHTDNLDLTDPVEGIWGLTFPSRRRADISRRLKSMNRQFPIHQVVLAARRKGWTEPETDGRAGPSCAVTLFGDRSL